MGTQKYTGNYSKGQRNAYSQRKKFETIFYAFWLNLICYRTACKNFDVTSKHLSFFIQSYGQVNNEIVPFLLKSVFFESINYLSLYLSFLRRFLIFYSLTSAVFSVRLASIPSLFVNFCQLCYISIHLIFANVKCRQYS